MIMIMPASIIRSLSNAQEVWHRNIFNQYQQEMHWVAHPTFPPSRFNMIQGD